MTIGKWRGKAIVRDRRRPDNFGAAAPSLTTPLRHVADAAECISQGDLTGKIAVSGGDELSSAPGAGNMNRNLLQIVAGITDGIVASVENSSKTGVRHVNVGAEELAKTADVLLTLVSKFKLA